MEEWGLQAVVKGVINDQFMITSTNPEYSCFDSFLDLEKEFINQELVFPFSDLLETSTSIRGNELEGLYKPFRSTSMAPQAQAIAPATIQVIKEEEKDQILKPSFEFPTPAVPRGPKHKTRKNQHKKVVLHVTADGLSSDLWAWRKYGQKPIKGSPYPRSYYRCSSSKGCLARRQVEQSCTNTGMYIITYTAEHNHAQPTRRNSLAGINRHKFSALKNQNRDNSTTICNDSPISSPTVSPLSSSVEEQPIKEERRRECEEDHEPVAMEYDGNEFVIPDIMLNDDFFAGVGSLDEIASDLAFCNHSKKQFPVSFVANMSS